MADTTYHDLQVELLNITYERDMCSNWSNITLEKVETNQVTRPYIFFSHRV